MIVGGSPQRFAVADDHGRRGSLVEEEADLVGATIDDFSVIEIRGGAVGAAGESGGLPPVVVSVERYVEFADFVEVVKLTGDEWIQARLYYASLKSHYSYEMKTLNAGAMDYLWAILSILKTARRHC